MTDEIARAQSSDGLMRSFDGQLRFAAALVKSGFLPPHLKTPEQALVVVLTGKELGLSPMQSIRSIAVVSGKVVLSADLILALLGRAGVKHQWIETTDTKATIRLSRDGYEPYTHSFTIEEAERAGLMSNQVWRKYAPAMLRARCISASARAYAPDVAMGMYETSEMAELEQPSESKKPSKEARDAVQSVKTLADGATDIEALHIVASTSGRHYKDIWDRHPELAREAKDYLQAAKQRLSPKPNDPASRRRKDVVYPLSDGETPADAGHSFESIKAKIEAASDLEALGKVIPLIVNGKLTEDQKGELGQMGMDKEIKLGGL